MCSGLDSVIALHALLCREQVRNRSPRASGPCGCRRLVGVAGLLKSPVPFAGTLRFQQPAGKLAPYLSSLRKWDGYRREVSLQHLLKAKSDVARDVSILKHVKLTIR